MDDWEAEAVGGLCAVLGFFLVFFLVADWVEDLPKWGRFALASGLGVACAWMAWWLRELLYLCCVFLQILLYLLFWGWVLWQVLCILWELV
jgi:hypothetical protein